MKSLLQEASRCISGYPLRLKVFLKDSRPLLPHLGLFLSRHANVRNVMHFSHCPITHNDAARHALNITCMHICIHVLFIMFSPLLGMDEIMLGIFGFLHSRTIHRKSHDNRSYLERHSVYIYETVPRRCHEKTAGHPLDSDISGYYREREFGNKWRREF